MLPNVVKSQTNPHPQKHSLLLTVTHWTRNRIFQHLLQPCGPRGRDLTLSKTCQPADDRNMNFTYQTPSLNIWKRSWSEMGSNKSPSPRFLGTSRQEWGKGIIIPAGLSLGLSAAQLKPVLAEALPSPSSPARVQTAPFRDTHSWDFITSRAGIPSRQVHKSLQVPLQPWQLLIQEKIPEGATLQQGIHLLPVSKLCSSCSHCSLFMSKVERAAAAWQGFRCLPLLSCPHPAAGRQPLRI